MGKYEVQYQPTTGDEWLNADWDGFTYDSLSRAEARARIDKYDYRIVDLDPKVVKEYPATRPLPARAVAFEVGETYAHEGHPTDFLYKIAYEFEDGQFLLIYDDPYNDGKLTSLKYQPNTAKFFIKKT